MVTIPHTMGEDNEYVGGGGGKPRKSVGIVGAHNGDAGAHDHHGGPEGSASSATIRKRLTNTYATFNFVGKLLGPKGNSLRRLQEETLCKMTVLGRNSMRDRAKEEELRSSKDPKYAHLNSDLHVEISTIAPPAEAYARIAYAMADLTFTWL
ncbi:hypothetical protein ACLKA6_020011 [Drosophila palustris]